MTTDVDDRSASLARRLDRFRTATRTSGATGVENGPDPGHLLGSAALAERLADAVDGEIMRTAQGLVVRCEVASRSIPLDRDRLASLPGQPARDVPLVCLDTETTGLATATGTVAFLIGLGWWEGERFRQVQLLLPDHAAEPALLTVLGTMIPPDAWLVTYNGRGFDWPLLVTRFRMSRRPPPPLDGHLDLLPIVRRLFRHRLADARLRTVETGVLGMERHGDVDGADIPRHYLGFLRGGPVGPIVEVVRHNDQDVRSLARLLAHLDQGYGHPMARRTAPAGDLAGLARAFARAGRLDDALECYDDALAAPITIADGTPARPVVLPPRRAAPDPAPWWSAQVPADFGERPRPVPRPDAPNRTAAFAAPWTTERIAVERAHLLQRLRRWDEAADAWASLAAGAGRVAIVAAVELAKLHEHRRRDIPAALAIVTAGLSMADRRRRLGRPEPRLEEDLERRIERLRRRACLRRSMVRSAAGRSRSLPRPERPPTARSPA